MLPVLIRKTVWATVLLQYCGVAFACGPFFPNRVLLGGDEVLLGAPRASFAEELDHIKAGVSKEFASVEVSMEKERRYMQEAQRRQRKEGVALDYSFGDRYRRQTSEAGLADLQAALGTAGYSEYDRGAVEFNYKSARKAVMEFGKSMEKWRLQATRRSKRDTSTDQDEQPELKRFIFHRLMPKEFSEYLKGAVFYHKGESDKAIKTWKKLLKLPEKKRHYRSTWAAFMIGKALLETKPDEARQWFRRVRELAAAGYADNLGLASSSLGWEGQICYTQQRYAEAIELYVAQAASGDRTALASLRFSASGACNADGSVLADVARHETARKVLTAYMLSYRKGVANELKMKWLAAVERAKIDAVEEGDRLAWAAYQCGNFEVAKRWLAVGPKDSAIARWIRAKLFLRGGKIPEAAEELAAIVREYPEATRPRSSDKYHDGFVWDLSEASMGESVRGELGVLQMSRGQYVEALDVLLRGGHWDDAAYVAERVLTADELIEYVNAKRTEVETDSIDDRWYMWRSGSKPEWCTVRIRYLLGRRLARLGRWKEARGYYPKKWRERFDLWVDLLGKGQNAALSDERRARSLWKAACMARYEGIVLLGTEVEPDWFAYGGRYALEGFGSIRILPSPNELFASSADERRRLKENVVPEKRWHYRYLAADYAWKAAELMPDGTDETAAVLCISGSWLKGKDPEAADKFYKALVIRCGNTELGKEADKLRWFPKVDINVEELLK